MTSWTSRPSLLFPHGTSQRSGIPHTLNEHDLGLAPIIRALDFDHRHSGFIAGVFNDMSADPATIQHRQAVLADMVRLPALVSTIEALLPAIRELSEARPFLRNGVITPLLLVSGRMGELANYVQCVEGLAGALDMAANDLRAGGLCALRDYLAALRVEPDYARLTQELPGLQEQLSAASSVTIGINLSGDLQPEGATILSLNATRFSGKSSLLNRLFGEAAADEALRGVSALYKASEGRGQTPEHEFFRDLNRLMERVATPISNALERYKRLNTAGLTALEAEFAFFVGAAQFATRLQRSGLPICHPTIAPQAERTCIIQENYSLDLVLRNTNAMPERIVHNDVLFDYEHHLLIITGPNSGGKTTYTRAVGQAHVLFQAGLLVPGTSARISPVDHIYTHFASAEQLDHDGGRLDEELARMVRIFDNATRGSLILFNEPLTSTNHQAAQRIASDIIYGLQVLGARAIFVTHLYELYDELANRPGALAGIVSLVAGSTKAAEQTTPTYKIVAGTPHVHTHAYELAERYGLDRIALEQHLQARGLQKVRLDDGAVEKPPPA